MPGWIIPYWLVSYLPNVTFADVLNSNFITSLLGAGAGAWAGAYAAQRIIERAKLREEIRSQIRNANAAIGLSFFICSLCISLKEQHVARIKAPLDETRKSWRRHQSRLAMGHQPSPFIVSADFRVVHTIKAPVETLEKLVFDKLSLGHRPLSMFAILMQTLDALNAIIIERTNLIANFESTAPHTDLELIEFYLGVPNSAGIINERYPSSVDAMSRYTDDCIFFSNQLSKDIYENATKLLELYKSKFKTPYPRLDKQQLKTEKLRLVPDEKEFSSWMALPN